MPVDSWNRIFICYIARFPLFMNIKLMYDPVRADLVHDTERMFTGRIISNGRGECRIVPFDVSRFKKMADSKYAIYLTRIAQIVVSNRPDLVYAYKRELVVS
jgi:hypothetical protein